MKSKLIENIGYMSIALVLALTLVLSFSVIDFNSNVTAYAAAPSDNALHIYPGSTSILAPGFDYEDAEIYYFDGDTSYFNSAVALTVLDVDYFDNNPDSLIQFIFYVDGLVEGDIYHIYLDNVSLPLSYYDVASDNGYSDKYFVYTYSFYALSDVYDQLVVEVFFHQFLDDYFANFERVCLYDVRLINSDSVDNDTVDNFFSIVGDGISFGFESIAGGITYTVDNLFFEDGNLTDFSVIIFAMTGVSLALAIIKYIMRIIFSFGGIKL